MKIKYLLLIVLSIITVQMNLFTETGDYKKILEKLDSQARFDESDFSAVYTIISEKPEKGKELFQARMFRRDREDKFVYLILEPDAYKGQGALMIDDNLWVYDPESRKFSHSSVKENFQDSEAKNNDFKASSLANDYSIEKAEEGKLGKFDVYILDLKANNNEVPYPREKIWVRKDETVILKMEDYSLSGKLVRTAAFLGYVRIKGKYLPTKILIIDELQKGEKTQITVENVSTDKLPDSVFKKTYLERVNQ
ncbi:MAG: outer membrane lipoprotein-sorting protein [Spirochaetales bacterium]|nr:outer membrane lipoprotein-sorting protein [Spirochaetales bacterium]